MIEFLKAILFGIVEGITEWLPVSSTGHMILLDEFVKLRVSGEFYEMFRVVIQLGAILAVILLFWNKLYPFGRKKTPEQKKNTWQLWFKVIVAVLPSAVIGLVLDDWMDAHLYNYIVVAIMLIVYGVAFILMEKNRQKSGAMGALPNGRNSDLSEWPRSVSDAAAPSARRAPGTATEDVYAIDYKTALLIGAFQCLALIPGTSRSGATILGALVLGVARPAGAEFSFFLAIPTMLGASALKLLKFLLSGVEATGTEVGILVVGTVVSFVVSLAAIKALMGYVRKHSFSLFGIYRILLGIAVLAYFLIK